MATDETNKGYTKNLKQNPLEDVKETKKEDEINKTKNEDLSKLESRLNKIKNRVEDGKDTFGV